MDDYRPLKIILDILIAACLIGVIAFFWPVLSEEIRYSTDQMSNVKYVIGYEQLSTFEKPLSPANMDFSIIIPKIAAVAPIIDNVDPNDEYMYLPALKQGVAHVLGSALPGDKGNVYLFAHADDDFYDVQSYNAAFFLLGKLKSGDEIDIFFRHNQIKYTVDQVKIIEPSEVQYLSGSMEQKTLTIQTDYPPGLTSKRLIVTATEEETP